MFEGILVSIADEPPEKGKYVTSGYKLSMSSFKAVDGSAVVKWTMVQLCRCGGPATQHFTPYLPSAARIRLQPVYIRYLQCTF